MWGEEFTVKKSSKFLDLTSMIDVIFILLLFFMVTTTFSKLGIPVNQPEAESVSKTPLKTITIGIDIKGNPYYEKDQLTAEQLTQLVKEKLKSKPDLVVILHADKESQIQPLISIMDTCKKAGATQFSIAAKKI